MNRSVQHDTSTNDVRPTVQAIPAASTSDDPGSATIQVEVFDDQASMTMAVAQVHEAEIAYRLDQPLMPDSAFDALKDRVAATKAAHPDWDDEGVTAQVASGAPVGGEVRHSSPMLSLAKATTADEVRAFLASLDSNADADGEDPGPLVVEAKLDGCAIAAIYTDGKLVQAAQRGDGTSGDPVTEQLLRGNGVAGLPAHLSTPSGAGWSGEVRGELFMTNADFEVANQMRVAAGRPAFANPRNAVSGTLRNLNRTYDVPLSFAAYDISGDGLSGDGVPKQDSATYSERLDAAETLGFATGRQLLPDALRAPREGVQDVLAAIEAVEQLRPSLGFPIDGSLESRLLR